MDPRLEKLPEFITIQAINGENLSNAGKCDGVFTVGAKLVLFMEEGKLHYRIEAIIPYEKRYPVEEVDYRLYINHPDQAAFLAYVDGAVAGEIRLRRNWNHYAYVEDIVVDIHFRGRGIGRALIQKAVEWARAKGLPGIMLETQDNNVAACRLYERCGFELGGFDRRLYQGIDPHTEEVALYWYLVF